MAAHEAVDAISPQPLIPEDTFALRLVIIRRTLGLSQEEAAERCGLDDGSWSNWENGRKPRGMDKVVGTISSQLGIDRDWLMWGGPLSQNLKFRISHLSPVPDVTGQLNLDDELDAYGMRPFLTPV